MPRTYRLFIYNYLQHLPNEAVKSMVSGILNGVSRAQDSEARFKAVGMIEGKLHVVVATKRSGMCRIISARRANATEERAHADG